MVEHPRQEDLAGLVFGDLSDDQAEEVALHVDRCPQCEDTVRELETASDDVIRVLRRPVVEHPFEQEPECHRLVEVIETIGYDPSMAGASRPSAESPEERGTIRDYQLLAKLGQGGMGTVYKALHGKLKKVVALKVLPAERMKHTHAVERFELEMEAVGRLTHPNIVTAFDAGEHEGTHFLVMEYVDGADLSELVQRLGPLPIADACELIRQAAVGLQHAHEHNLVHRDIKPSNLMLAQMRNAEVGMRKSEEARSSAFRVPHSAFVKILDLGLARLHNGDREELTSTGQMMGTVDYMAPEQTGDSHAVDIRADIYSMGATLFKLLCNRAPYADARYDTVLKKLKAMATQPIPAIQDHRSEVPDALAVVLEKMLATEPDERMATPQDVAEALASFAEGAELAALAARYQEAQHAADDAAGAAERSGRSTDVHLSYSMTETATEESSHRAPRAEHPVGQASRLTSSEPESAEGDRAADGAVVDGSPDPATRMTEGLPETAELAGKTVRPTVDDVARSGDRPQQQAQPGFRQAQPDLQTARWNRNTKIIAVVLGLAALFAGVMVIRLATDKGEIRITAYDPEIEVTIKRNDKPVDGFQVKQRPDGTSYYSGDYEIVIVGGKPDGVKIKNGTFTLTRDQTVLVEIVHVADAGRPAVDGVARSGDRPQHEPVVDGSPDPATRMTEGLDPIDPTAPTGRPTVDDVARSGDRPQPDGDRPQPDGDRPQPDGDRPQPESGDTPPEGLPPQPPVFPAGILPQPADLPGIGRWNVETARPRGQILAADWSPDGKQIACGMATGHIRIYDAQTLKLVRIIDGRTRRIQSVAWSPDGKRLASVGWPDGITRVWNDSGDAVTTYPTKGNIGALAWHPSGEWLAAKVSTNTCCIHLFGPDGAYREVRERSTQGRSIAWSPTGEWLAVGGTDGTVRLWRLDGTMDAVFHGERCLVDAVAWSPDGTRLASVGPNGSVIVWDTEGNIQQTLDTREGYNLLTSLAWSRDGQRLVAGGFFGVVWIWSLDGKEEETLDTQFPFVGPVLVVASAQQDKFLTAGRMDGDLQLWTFDGERAGQALGAPIVTSVDCGRHGLIASGDEENRLRFWESDGRLIRSVTTHEAIVRSIAWHPNGSVVASGDVSGTCFLHSHDGTLQKRFADTEKGGMIQIGWDQTGDRLATLHGNNLMIWDTEGTKLRHRHVGNLGYAWSWDGERIAMAGSDGVGLWDLERDEVTTIFDKSTSSTYAVAWDPQGNKMALGVGPDVVIVDESGKEEQIWQPSGPRASNSGNVFNLCWDPAGHRVLAATGYGKVDLWSISGQHLAAIWDHVTYHSSGAFPACCWTHDGRHFLTAAFDGTIRYYQADPVEPQWVAVNLPDDKAVTFSPTGDILHGDPEVVDKELVYLVETDDGRCETLTPSEFQERVKAAAAKKDASTAAQPESKE